MHQTAKVAEVFIRRDPITGDVVLSRKPTGWQGLLDAVAFNKEEARSLRRLRRLP